MNSIKLIAICVVGAALATGCASSSRPSSSQAVASAQRTIQSGKVTAVEAVAVVDQSAVTTSSGGSAVVTTATAGGPEALTVTFADGSQGRYIIEHPKAAYTVGQPVRVITDGDRITILSQ